jgi:uncharacterized protein YaiE (UPF0345 family)
MSTFTQVSVVREANIYFDGKVTSRTVLFDDGSRKTLGIMQVGEYTFDTKAGELMEILSGDLDVQLPGGDQWQPVRGGESFEVPPDSLFKLRVKSVTDYCCSYR